MANVSDDEFAAAGLYDPVRDVANGRLDLLRWLASFGMSIDEMVEADARLALGAAPGDQRLHPGELFDRTAAIERSGLSDELFDSIATALGFTPVHGAAPGELGLVDAEIRAIAAFGQLAAVFSEPEAISFLRVLGSSMARLGESAVSLFLVDVEGPHLEAGESEYDLAKKVFDGVGLLDEFTTHLDPLLRRHVLQATERSRLSLIDSIERVRQRYAVGFVDLVGFTELSGTMSTDSLAGFLRDFEGQAYDVATEHGARVVKLIGDEVMFVATDADRACRTAVSLMGRFEGQGVTPRGGIALGDVIVRGGDYFGSDVNLASRLVDEAVPGEVLVTEPLAAAATTCSFEPAGRRQVKGFADPIPVRTLLTVT